MPPASSTSSISAAGDAAAKPTYVPTFRERPVPIRRSARACAYCRKSKARCDGPELWPCRRCRESCVDCVFEGVPQHELGSKNLGGQGEDGLPIRPSSPFSLERRMQVLEQEVTQLRRTCTEHSARFRMMDAGNASNGHSHASTSALQLNGMSGPPPLPINGQVDPTENMSLDDPATDDLARKAFDTFWTSMAPWAPYMDPINDTYHLLRVRSPLLLFCILAITSRFHNSPQFAHFCEAEALRHMRSTLYSDTMPTLDDCKGTALYNGWLSRGSPPGHSMTLAAQLELPKALEKLLSNLEKSPAEATKAFDHLMPGVRTWLSLYAQDLWLSVATGRRSMVTIDYSITSARSLLKFAALRPVDARMVAQCELVTILGGVQESFLKTAKHSIAETVKIIQQADEHLDFWMKTWTEWARLQEEATGTYMTTSFSMQLHVGRFYINTLGLRDITTGADVQSEQIPVIKTAIRSATEIQKVVVDYGPDRMAYATEFTLISSSSAALFLLKMIKLLPDAVSDIHAALAAVRESSKLLAGCPRQNYHLAVAGALAHLEGQILSPPFAMSPRGDAHVKSDPMLGAGVGASNVSATGSHDDQVLFDPDLELAISSVIGSSDFWSWNQSLPADSFAGILS